jgi:hypothetical protein
LAACSWDPANVGLIALLPRLRSMWSHVCSVLEGSLPYQQLIQRVWHFVVLAFARVTTGHSRTPRRMVLLYCSDRPADRVKRHGKP